MSSIRHAWLALATAAALSPFAAAPAEAQKRDRDRITREELEASAQKSTDLYRAIKSLRAHMLSGSRGVRSMGIERGVDDRGNPTLQAGGRAIPPVVYIDGSRSGDAEVLKSVLTTSVAEVRFLDPNKALMEYGTGHEGGAILVTLLK